jgi:hypothetical protein
MVGAGRKETDNSFSGVLMGDIREGSGSGTIDTGLYGFHQGSASFGFNIDGTVFLGKNGKGRISFDGNYGYIQSALWNGSKGLSGIVKQGT